MKEEAGGTGEWDWLFRCCYLPQNYDTLHLSLWTSHKIDYFPQQHLQAGVYNKYAASGPWEVRWSFIGGFDEFYYCIVRNWRLYNTAVVFIKYGSISIMAEETWFPILITDQEERNV